MVAKLSYISGTLARLFGLYCKHPSRVASTVITVADSDDGVVFSITF